MIPNSAFGFARRHPVVSSQVVGGDVSGGRERIGFARAITDETHARFVDLIIAQDVIESVRNFARRPQRPCEESVVEHAPAPPADPIDHRFAMETPSPCIPRESD